MKLSVMMKRNHEICFKIPVRRSANAPGFCSKMMMACKFSTGLPIRKAVKYCQYHVKVELKFGLLTFASQRKVLSEGQESSGV